MTITDALTETKSVPGGLVDKGLPVKTKRMSEPIFTGDWYPWYPEKALTSEGIDGLSLSEEGAYRRALDKAWLKGSIPTDPKEAARVIGKGCTSKMAARILALFTPIRGNKKRSVNLPQERIRAEQKEKHEKRVEAGKLRQAVKANKNKGQFSNAQPMQDQCHTDKEEDIKNKNKKEELRVVADTPQAAATTATKKPQVADDEWLDGLQANPAYQSLEVRKEFARAMVWTETNGRQCTRRFFVNWLNRAKPMTTEITTNGTSKQPTTFRAQRGAEIAREGQFFDELRRATRERHKALSNGSPDDRPRELHSGSTKPSD